MPTVHAGTQLRWYEELCRIKIIKLREVANSKGNRLTRTRLPARGGVYCFWWTGNLTTLQSPSCNMRLELVGPGGRPVLLELDEEWLGLGAGLPVPLYVGKNADSIFSRVTKHLLLNQARITAVFDGHKKQRRPSTSCQARAGVEHLFPKLTDTRPLVLDNMGLSWVTLHGDDHAANRFYLEDLAIGLMRPVFNVDVER